MSQIIYSIVTEQPDTEPITLQEAKDHLEYDGTRKDGYINGLITAARKVCEVYTGLSFVTQERSVKIDRFPWNKSRYITLPYGPVQNIVSVVYTDSEGSEITMDDSDYGIDTQSSVSRFYPIDSNGARGCWPTDVVDRANAITVVYQTGYDPVSGQPLPAQAKIAMLRLIAKMFENRGDQGGKDGMIDWDTQTLLDDIKVTWNAEICTD